MQGNSHSGVAEASGFEPEMSGKDKTACHPRAQPPKKNTASSYAQIVELAEDITNHKIRHTNEEYDYNGRLTICGLEHLRVLPRTILDFDDGTIGELSTSLTLKSRAAYHPSPTFYM